MYIWKRTYIVKITIHFTFSKIISSNSVLYLIWKEVLAQPYHWELGGERLKCLLLAQREQVSTARKLGSHLYSINVVSQTAKFLFLSL